MAEDLLATLSESFQVDTLSSNADGMLNSASLKNNYCFAVNSMDSFPIMNMTNNKCCIISK